MTKSIFQNIKFSLTIALLSIIISFVLFQYSYANTPIDVNSPKVQDFINQVSKKHKILDKEYLTKVLKTANHNQEVIDKIKKPYEGLAWSQYKIYGSYAGAMGYPQFISSSFRHYAVDFTNDGHRDLLNNPQDAIGSVANYFYKHGWEKNKPVTLATNITNTKFKALKNIKDLKPKFQIKTLEKHGVKVSNANEEIINKLDNNKNTIVSLIELTDKKDKKDSSNPNSEYWIGFKNFYVITRYNLSHNYAMAVYQLSQKIKQKHDEALVVLK